MKFYVAQAAACFVCAAIVVCRGEDDLWVATWILIAMAQLILAKLQDMSDANS